MLELHHHEMSTCSQKVRLALSEKEAEWKSHIVDILSGGNRTPEFLKLNPNGVVPVIVSDSAVILESTIINEFIEDKCDGPRLMLAGAEARARARLWVREIDEKIHPAIGVITFATALRESYLARPRDEVVAEFSDGTMPEYAALRLALLDEGPRAAAFQAAAATTALFLRKVDAALQEAWLVGDAFTLADCALAPYVVRLEHLGASSLWEGGRLPRLSAWLDALHARPSFDTAIVNWLTEPALALLAQGAESLVPALERHVA